MQNPVGAQFNFQTMRMELVSFGSVLFNPVAQAKFVHPRRWLRRGLGVRALDQFLVPAAWPQRRRGQALDGVAASFGWPAHCRWSCSVMSPGISPAKTRR